MEPWVRHLHSPSHIGEFVREIIAGHNLNVSAAARLLGVTRQALSTPAPKISKNSLSCQGQNPYGTIPKPLRDNPKTPTGQPP